MNDRRIKYSSAAAIAMVTFIVYLPSLRNGFVIWDDDIFILQNLHIRSLNGEFFRWALTDTSLDFWRPVVWISHALDYACWGLNPAGHHLTSILLHSLNTYIIILLLLRILESARALAGDIGSAEGPMHDLRTGRAALLAACVTGALFGIHPLHVESVAWATTRTDLLYSLFFMLSLMTYAGHVVADARMPDDRSPWSFVFEKRYLLSLVFYVLAIASKPMAITMPLILVLLDWYPFRRLHRRSRLFSAIVEKVPFLSLSLALSISTLAGQQALANIEPLANLHFTPRILVACKAIVLYLWKMAAPIRLSPFYPYPEQVSFAMPGYYLPVLLVCGLTAMLILLAGRRPLWLLVWGYYVVSLLPVLGLVKARAVEMADRYTYLPSIGPFFIVGIAAAWLWTKSGHRKDEGKVLKRACIIAAIIISISLTYRTERQIALWNNTIDLWSAVISQEPERVPLAYNNRGLAYRAKGEYLLAIQDYDRALELSPIDATVRTNRGIAYAETGRFDRALADFDAAIAYDAKYADAYTSRGLVYSLTGRYGRALEDYDRAIALKPASVDAYLNRGDSYEQTGRLDRAVSDYDTAVSLDPTDPLAYGNRGRVFAKMDRVDRALADLNRAIALKPDFAKAYLERGRLYSRAGSPGPARSDFTRACELGSTEGCEALKEIGS